MNNQVKFIIFLIFLISLSINSFGKARKIADLPEVMKPFFMTLDHQYLYITEYGSRIHIYKRSPDGLIFIKNFGRAGEGPGELSFVHRLTIKDDCLEIPTFGKYARFNHTGDFIDEQKLRFQVFKNSIFKVGDNYLDRNLVFANKSIQSQLKLYKQDFTLRKILGEQSEKYVSGRIMVVRDYFSCRSADKQIYIIHSSEQTTLKVLNSDGDHIKTVRLNLPSMEIEKSLRQQLTADLRYREADAEWKQYKNRLDFPDRTPGLNYLDISKGIIITRTYRQKEEQAEFVFFDLNGTELKRKYLYNTGRTSNGTRFHYHDGTYYYIRENEDSETWELFEERIF